jgi:hypothetical protein
MRKYLLILLCILCCSTIRSQVLVSILFGDKLNTDKMAFGLVVGPGFSNISNIEGKPRAILDLGLYFTIRMKERWQAQIEMLPKVSFGAKDIPAYTVSDPVLDSLYSNGSVTRVIRAMTLSAFPRYKLSDKFFVEAGIQANLRTQANDVFETKVNDNDLKYHNWIKYNVTKVDFGLAGGIIYRFRPAIHSMAIGIRYYAGLTDIMKYTDGGQMNRSILFNVYIPIGSAKAVAKIQEEQNKK